MLEEELKPTAEEVRNWLISSLRHSCQVEYYLHQLKLGNGDPQRPHDLSGEGNKYSWKVIAGLAIQNRDDGLDFFQDQVLPAITFHRRYQYHHQMWNAPNSLATPDALKVGAVDAICSLLDDRQYQGGTHTFEEIENIIRQNDSHQAQWFWRVFSQMKRRSQPEIKVIDDLHDFPNIGISGEMFSRTVGLTQLVLSSLTEEQGYNGL